MDNLLQLVHCFESVRKKHCVQHVSRLVLVATGFFYLASFQNLRSELNLLSLYILYILQALPIS